jgi:putative DNA-invertase from lambdoid prophage Rac
MSRTFLYARVSTAEQTTLNQVEEVKGKGITVDPKRIVEETISGSVQAMRRPKFACLIEHTMESGDQLVVTKLDRLGRNAVDVMSTIDLLARKGIGVLCLQLGGGDLTSATGKLIMGVLVVVAEFELGLLKERTLAGQARARNDGKKFGRPPALSPDQVNEALRKLLAGEHVSAVARAVKTSRRTVQRLQIAHADKLLKNVLVALD